MQSALTPSILLLCLFLAAGEGFPADPLRADRELVAGCPAAAIVCPEPKPAPEDTPEPTKKKAKAQAQAG